MECPKCKGMMVLDRFSDFFLVFYAWKCMNCGAIIDRTIPIIVERVWLSENPRRLPRSKKILTWSLRPSRLSVQCGRPLGDAVWVKRMATRF